MRNICDLLFLCENGDLFLRNCLTFDHNECVKVILFFWIDIINIRHLKLMREKKTLELKWSVKIILQF